MANVRRAPGQAIAFAIFALIGGAILTYLMLEGVPPEVFFVLPFHGRIPRGTVACHPGFGADGR
jgi:hypothetical protein